MDEQTTQAQAQTAPSEPTAPPPAGQVQDPPAGQDATAVEEDRRGGGPDRRQSVVDRRSGVDRRKVERRVALERRRGPGRRRADDRRSAEEGEMTDEQFDFVMAIQRYKATNSRPFPSWTEVLDVIHALGYRKVAEPQDLR